MIVTELNTVCIPSDPKTPPAFVHLYKIPLDAYESTKENIDELL